MNLEQACIAAQVDQRIGVLCREGKPVFYVTINRECVERSSVDGVLEVLREEDAAKAQAGAEMPFDGYTYYKAVHPKTGAVAVRRTESAVYEYASMTNLGGASWANSLKNAKTSRYAHLGAIVPAEEITREEYLRLKAAEKTRNV